MEHPKPFSFHFDQNPFSVLSATSDSSSTSSDPAPPPQPRFVPSRRSGNIRKLIRVSTTYSTSSARAQSFKEWPLANITPQQLAKLGFYHTPQNGILDKVCCFACEAEASGFEPTRAFTIEELLLRHKEDCLWEQMLRDVELCVVDSQPASLTDASSPTGFQPLQNNHTDAQPMQENNSNFQSQNLESPTPTETLSPSLSTNSPKPTYASVLKTQPQSEIESSPHISRPSSLSSSKTPSTQTHCSSDPATLTVEDLYKRFHNRPSPLNSPRFNSQHPDSPQHQLNLVAVNSLSKFLRSALPAFTRFLSDIQGGQYNSPVYFGGKDYNWQFGTPPRKWKTQPYRY